MVGSRVSNRMGQSWNVPVQIEIGRPQPIVPLSLEKKNPSPKIETQFLPHYFIISAIKSEILTCVSVIKTTK